jgi:hypothetical protein
MDVPTRVRERSADLRNHIPMRRLTLVRSHCRLTAALPWLMLCVANGSYAQAPPLAPTAPPASGWAPVVPVAPANTTIVPRSAATPSVAQATQVTMSAVLTDEGQVIEQGATWRIFRGKPGIDGKLELITQSKDASPVLKLDPGDYIVNVAFGRAHLTRRVTLQAGKASAERFVINAGGLRLSAVLATGEPAPEKSVVYDILSEERDQFGQRIQVMTGARPGLIIRLNAGIYRIVSTYGDANAAVTADLTVEPGKLTNATVTHSAAKVTLRLVSKPGGEAIADTQWTITTLSGDPIKDSVGALPSHILAPGNYAVVAKSGGQNYKRDFAIKGGDVVIVEVVAR